RASSLGVQADICHAILHELQAGRLGVVTPVQTEPESEQVADYLALAHAALVLVLQPDEVEVPPVVVTAEPLGPVLIELEAPAAFVIGKGNGFHFASPLSGDFRSSAAA